MDYFNFADALSADTISDFVHGEDRMSLRIVAVPDVPQIYQTRMLDVTEFKNLSLGPVDSTDRILYDPATGTVFLDMDGSGSAAATLFAVLQGGPVLYASDITVLLPFTTDF